MNARRVSSVILAWVTVLTVVLTCVQSEVVRSQGATVAPAPASTRAVLDKYCVTCHNERRKVAGLMLDKIDPARIADDAQVWEKVARKLRTHDMPPPGSPRPDPSIYASMVSSLEGELDKAALANPNPGRVAVHRLNRTEYTNAIRDLLGLEIDGASLLPGDEPDQQSFDTIASVLSVSPTLLESYLSAATKVSRLAIGDPSGGAVISTYGVPRALVQDDRTDEALPFGTRGGAAVKHLFPVDGEYSIRLRLRRELYLYIIGMGEPHQVDVRLDGVLLRRFSVGGEAPGKPAPETFVGNTQGDIEWEVYMHEADKDLELRVPVKAGTHEVGVSFVRRFWAAEGVLQPPQRGFAKTTNEVYHGNPGLDSILIGGPYLPLATDDTPSRRRVFTCRPKDAAGEEPCARKILSALATRAYRRPVTESEVDLLVRFFNLGREEAGFDAGIERGLERILAAPSFLFRVERAPANLAAGTPYRLSDVDLASRLSFFLWSSIPDEQLLDLAVRGRLSDPAVLEQQVRRMLADDRSRALVDNFANQWLKLGKIPGIVPDVDQFPDFDENLRQAMQQETTLFIESQLRDDRSIGDLLTADYTFVNARLAKHYGIPNIYGEHFRRVTLADGRRGGLLTHASVLTITSYPNRTSPVVRGKWLLENIFGSPPPSPPDDVPALKESGENGAPRSVRERMELHRRNPTCAVCHVRMDPLGFSLENYDALGRWRTVSDGAPIDTAVALPDGTKFDGIAGLRSLLVSHRQEFVNTFAEKLLSYALGRGIEYYDLPVVRRITKEAAAGDYRWSSLIVGIARSAPFTMASVHDSRRLAE